MQQNSRWIALLAVALLIALAPLAFPSAYYYRIGTLIFINGLAVTGLVILMGYTGLISLGHAGFMGIGAYSCAILPARLGLAPPLALLLGVGLAALVAWLVGRPILRLKGYYLAVATLGFGMLITITINNEIWLTGGPDGIAVPPLGLKRGLEALGLRIKSTLLWYWLSAGVLLFGMYCALSLRNSATGRALRALHDAETAAAFAGIVVAQAKLQAFVLSAVYAALAGGMLALFNQFITPEVAGLLHSIELVAMAVLGGVTSVAGGLVGAAMLTLLPQALTVFHDYEQLLLGAIMILTMIFMRQGLLPGLAQYVHEMRKKWRF